MASGIVCGCLPVLPQFFHHYVPKVRKSLTTTRRSKSQSRSKICDTSKGSQADTWTQALVKGNYVELDEQIQSKERMGAFDRGRKQVARSDTKITAQRDISEQKSSAMGKEIYTQRTITVE